MSNFVPRPGSLWLVVVECRHNVVAVCVSGKGFYIPGQEPCWHFSHVDQWIAEIDPEKMNIFFHTDGTAACLHSEKIPLVQLGTLTIRRASQIEFNHARQEWEVRLALQDGSISGDIVFSNPSRDKCLAWEEKFFDLAGA
jgi:hypothetical protein